MSRYLAGRNLSIGWRDSRGKQAILTLVPGEVAPRELSASDAAPFLAAGFLAEISDDEAARQPTPADPVQRAFLASF